MQITLPLLLATASLPLLSNAAFAISYPVATTKITAPASVVVAWLADSVRPVLFEIDASLPFHAFH